MTLIERSDSYPIEDPYPHTIRDLAICVGFGRGSSELGIPTANVPLNDFLAGLPTGVYYGWCKLKPQDHEEHLKSTPNREIQFNYGKSLEKSELEVLPMVMSVGWNPTYNDLKEKAVEIHIIHKFSETFYGAHIDYTILGFLRPELKFINVETLILEINRDIEITESLLLKDEQIKYKQLL